MDEWLKETVIDWVNTNDSIINNYVNDIEQNDINNIDSNSPKQELFTNQDVSVENDNKIFKDFEVYTIFSVIFILIIIFWVLYYIYKHKKNVLE